MHKPADLLSAWPQTEKDWKTYLIALLRAYLEPVVQTAGLRMPTQAHGEPVPYRPWSQDLLSDQSCPSFLQAVSTKLIYGDPMLLK